MTRLARLTTVLSLLAAVASCDAIKSKLLGGANVDAGEDAAPAVVEAEIPDSAPPPVVGPIATNEDDVARFPDEVRLDAPATILSAANVREVPAVGKVVAALPKGTAVVQLTRRDKFFLVVFDDPKTPGSPLMGWVTQDAFTVAVAATDAGVKTLTCTAPDVALFSDGAFCGRACTKDADCPQGQVCKGSAMLVQNGKPGAATTVCSAIVTHDAGAPAPAVAPATTDAGGGGASSNLLRPSFLTLGFDAGVKPATPATPAIVDAGAAKALLPTLPAAPTGAVDVVEPTGGLCPVGFHLVPKDKKCHRICNFDCKGPTTQRCIKCGTGIKVCSATNDLCN